VDTGATGCPLLSDESCRVCETCVRRITSILSSLLFYPLPWKVLKYSNEYGGYVVPLPKSILEKAPKYSESEIPSYGRDYGTRVDSYYQQY
jgi:hypothetical protein